METRRNTAADDFRDISYLEPWYTVRAHRSGKLVMAPRMTTGPDGRAYARFRGTDFALDRLIADAFMPNPDRCSGVIHRNGDLTDCSADNLAWDERTAGTFPVAGLEPAAGSFHPVNAEARAAGCAVPQERRTEVREPSADGEPFSVVATDAATGAQWRCDLSPEVYDAVRAHVREAEMESMRAEMEKRIRDELIDEIYSTVKTRLTRENIRELADNEVMLFVPKDMNVISRPADLERAMLSRLASICALTIDKPEMFDSFLRKFAEKIRHSEIESVVLSEGPAMQTLEKRIATLEKRISKEAVLERRNFLREEKRQLAEELANIRADREKGSVGEYAEMDERRREFWNRHWRKFEFEDAPEPAADSSVIDSSVIDASVIDASVIDGSLPAENGSAETGTVLPKSAMEVPLATYDAYGTVGEAIRTVKRTHQSALAGVDIDITNLYKESEPGRGPYRKRPVQLDPETVREWIDNPDAAVERAMRSGSHENPLMDVPGMRQVRRVMKDPERNARKKAESMESMERNAEMLSRGGKGRALGSRGRKPVIVTLPNGTERQFRSLGEASEFSGVPGPEISRCCRGIKASAFGLKFRFADAKDVSRVLAEYARAVEKMGIPVVDSSAGSPEEEKD